MSTTPQQAPFTPQSVMSESIASFAEKPEPSDLQSVLHSAVQIGGNEPRALRKQNRELDAQVARLKAELEDARAKAKEARVKNTACDPVTRKRLRAASDTLRERDPW